MKGYWSILDSRDHTPFSTLLSPSKRHLEPKLSRINNQVFSFFYQYSTSMERYPSVKSNESIDSLRNKSLRLSTRN